LPLLARAALEDDALEEDDVAVDAPAAELAGARLGVAGAREEVAAAGKVIGIELEVVAGKLEAAAEVESVAAAAAAAFFTAVAGKPCAAPGREAGTLLGGAADGAAAAMGRPVGGCEEAGEKLPLPLRWAVRGLPGRVGVGGGGACRGGGCEATNE
jgi:hypothetical protein